MQNFNIYECLIQCITFLNNANSMHYFFQNLVMVTLIQCMFLASNAN